MATRAGPIAPRDWGVTTQRGDTVFVHVLNWRDRQLAIPALPARIVSARIMGGGPSAFPVGHRHHSDPATNR